MPFGMLAERLAASRLGVAATWISKAGGPAHELRVVPSRPEAAFGTLEAPRGTGRVATVSLAAGAIPGRPEPGDLLAVEGTGYVVAVVEADPRGTSFALTLRRS